MSTMVLLAVVTLAYVGYNLFIKASGDHIPAGTTTTVLGAMLLQAAALATSAFYLVFLGVQGGHTFRLSTPSVLLALASGVCIAVAEICYLHIFSGPRTLPASVVIPTVVSGTVVITLIVSVFVFQERPGVLQFLGAGMVAAGIAVMYAGQRAT